MKWLNSLLLFCSVLLSSIFIAPLVAHAQGAGTFEISGGGSYSHNTYTADDYSWTRKYGFSFGFYLSDLTELEFSYQDITDRTKITGYEDTTFHDDIYGLTITQYFAPKNSWVQPYGKGGIGQLNREAGGTYALGNSPPERIDSVTGILGAGLKIYLSKTLGLRGEFTTYLANGHIATWKDNVSATYGISIYF